MKRKWKSINKERIKLISVSIFKEIKFKIATQFKIIDRSVKESTKIHASNNDNEVQKHVSYMEQQLETIQDKKYEVQEMKIDKNVEFEMVVEWVNITK